MNKLIILVLLLTGCAGLKFQANPDKYAVEDSAGYYRPTWGHGGSSMAAGASVGWLFDLKNTVTGQNACQFIAGTGQVAQSIDGPSQTDFFIGMTALKCFGFEITPAIAARTGRGVIGVNFSIKGF